MLGLRTRRLRELDGLLLGVFAFLAPPLRLVLVVVRTPLALLEELLDVGVHLILEVRQGVGRVALLGLVQNERQLGFEGFVAEVLVEFGRGFGDFGRLEADALVGPLRQRGAGVEALDVVGEVDVGDRQSRRFARPSSGERERITAIKID